MSHGRLGYANSCRRSLSHSLTQSFIARRWDTDAYPNIYQTNAKNQFIQANEWQCCSRSTEVWFPSRGVSENSPMLSICVFGCRSETPRTGFKIDLCWHITRLQPPESSWPCFYPPSTLCKSIFAQTSIKVSLTFLKFFLIHLAA